MLALKAWRESRGRFLLSAGTLCWFCSLFVLFRPYIQYARNRPFAAFVVDAIYAGGVRNIFVLFVVAFGMGGLLQESARGTIALTLALPVTRARHIAARAGVGFVEVIALALVPSLCVLALAPWIGERFSVADALLYSAQWAATGAVLFAVAFLLSVWVSGANGALAAAVLVIATYGSILNVPALKKFPALDVFALMDRAHPGALRLTGAAVAALTIASVAAWATDRQDF